MSTQQQPLSVVDQVSTGIRQVVTGHVLGDPSAVRRLAVGLDVPEASIQKALTSPTWDLGLSIDAAQVLGLGIDVTLAAQATSSDDDLVEPCPCAFCGAAPSPETV